MKIILALSLVVTVGLWTSAQQVDYSVVSVPEESGTDFMKMTKDGDYVEWVHARCAGRMH